MLLHEHEYTIEQTEEVFYNTISLYKCSNYTFLAMAIYSCP